MLFKVLQVVLEECVFWPLLVISKFSSVPCWVRAFYRSLQAESENFTCALCAYVFFLAGCIIKTKFCKVSGVQSFITLAAKRTTLLTENVCSKQRLVLPLAENTSHDSLVLLIYTSHLCAVVLVQLVCKQRVDASSSLSALQGSKSCSCNLNTKRQNSL